MQFQTHQFAVQRHSLSSKLTPVGSFHNFYFCSCLLQCELKFSTLYFPCQTPLLCFQQKVGLITPSSTQTTAMASERSNWEQPCWPKWQYSWIEHLNQNYSLLSYCTATMLELLCFPLPGFDGSISLASPFLHFCHQTKAFLIWVNVITVSKGKKAFQCSSVLVL